MAMKPNKASTTVNVFDFVFILVRPNWVTGLSMSILNPNAKTVVNYCGVDVLLTFSEEVGAPPVIRLLPRKGF